MSIEDDRIEKLKRKLYSRATEPVLDIRSQIKNNETSVQSAWGETSELHISDDMKYTKSTHPFLKKFLFASSLFFVLSVAVSAFVFFGGGNLISSSNVDIKVAGPSIVASGEEIDLVVSFVNQNHTDLNSARLIIDYPSGSSGDKDSVTKLSHTEESIGTILSGSSNEKIIKLFLLGDKDTIKTVKFKLEYQVVGSNAVFSKEKRYDITIGSSPVIVNVSAPEEVNSGQDINFTATITSNSSSVLHDIIVVAEYPYGFTFGSSSLSPSGGNTMWNIGDLKSGDKKTLGITGKLVAQDGEQRTFKFSVGTKSADSSKNIDTVLSQAQPTVTVTKPFIDAHLSLQNDESPAISVVSGTSINGMIVFTNTLSDTLLDVSVTSTLSGEALNRQSIQSGAGGFYQSAMGNIVWNKDLMPALSRVSPGESRNAFFSFSIDELPVGLKNPTVNITLNIKGTRISTSGSIEDVSVSISRIVKAHAALLLSSKSLVGGPFVNVGAHPPKAEQTSSYTVHWSLTNKWNDVTGAKITTKLPVYVDWVGQVSPSTASVSYDSNTRTVTWIPGSVRAGAGFTSAPKEVFFQLKLNPSLSQVGTTPSLTSDVIVVGTDTFTDQLINFTSSSLTTSASDSGESGTVTK